MRHAPSPRTTASRPAAAWLLALATTLAGCGAASTFQVPTPASHPEASLAALTPRLAPARVTTQDLNRASAALLALGSPRRAHHLALRALAAAPRDATALVLAARAAMALGDPEEATSRYEDAVAERPDARVPLAPERAQAALALTQRLLDRALAPPSATAPPTLDTLGDAADALAIAARAARAASRAPTPSDTWAPALARQSVRLARAWLDVGAWPRARAALPARDAPWGEDAELPSALAEEVALTRALTRALTPPEASPSAHTAPDDAPTNREEAGDTDDHRRALTRQLTPLARWAHAAPASRWPRVAAALRDLGPPALAAAAEARALEVTHADAGAWRALALRVDGAGTSLDSTREVAARAWREAATRTPRGPARTAVLLEGARSLARPSPALEQPPSLDPTASRRARRRARAALALKLVRQALEEAPGSIEALDTLATLAPLVRSAPPASPTLEDAAHRLVQAHGGALAARTRAAATLRRAGHVGAAVRLLEGGLVGSPPADAGRPREADTPASAKPAGSEKTSEGTEPPPALPPVAAAWLEMARLRELQGDSARRDEALDRVQAIAGESLAGRLALGAALLRFRETERALAAAREAARLAPDDVEAALLLAHARQAAGARDRAHVELASFARRNARPRVLLAVGLDAWRQGDLPRTKRYLRRALDAAQAAGQRENGAQAPAELVAVRRRAHHVLWQLALTLPNSAAGQRTEAAGRHLRAWLQATPEGARAEALVEAVGALSGARGGRMGRSLRALEGELEAALVRRLPTSPAALWSQAWTLAGQRRWRRAQTPLLRAIARAEAPRDAAVAAAQRLLSRGARGAAVPLLLRTSPAALRPTSALGEAIRALLAAGEREAAERWLDALLRRAPQGGGQARLLLGVRVTNLARALVDAGLPERAADLYEAVLAQSPGDRRAGLGLVRALAQAGHQDRALREARALVEGAGRGNPTRQRARAEVAEALRGGGALGASAALLEEHLAHERGGGRSTSFPALFATCRSLEDRDGMLRAARLLVTRARRGARAAAAARAARALATAGLVDEARALLDESRREAGTEAQARDAQTTTTRALAVLALMDGDGEKARRLLETWVDLRGKSLSAWRDAGQLLAERGRWEDARALWDRAVESGYREAELLLERGRARLALGDPGGARDDLAQAVTLANAEPTVTSAARRALEAASRPDLARTLMAQALALAPARSEYRLELGRLSLALGDAASARRAFQAYEDAGHRGAADVARLWADAGYGEEALAAARRGVAAVADADAYRALRRGAELLVASGRGDALRPLVSRFVQRDGPAGKAFRAASRVVSRVVGDAGWALRLRERAAAVEPAVDDDLARARWLGTLGRWPEAVAALRRSVIRHASRRWDGRRHGPRGGGEWAAAATEEAARFLLGAGQLDRARALARWAAERAPADEQPTLVAARLALDAGDLPAATRWVRRFVDARAHADVGTRGPMSGAKHDRALALAEALGDAGAAATGIELLRTIQDERGERPPSKEVMGAWVGLELRRGHSQAARRVARRWARAVGGVDGAALAGAALLAAGDARGAAPLLRQAVRGPAGRAGALWPAARALVHARIALGATPEAARRATLEDARTALGEDRLAALRLEVRLRLDTGEPRGAVRVATQVLALDRTDRATLDALLEAAAAASQGAGLGDVGLGDTGPGATEPEGRWPSRVLDALQRARPRGGRASKLLPEAQRQLGRARAWTLALAVAASRVRAAPGSAPALRDALILALRLGDRARADQYAETLRRVLTAAAERPVSAARRAELALAEAGLEAGALVWASERLGAAAERLWPADGARADDVEGGHGGGSGGAALGLGAARRRWARASLEVAQARGDEGAAARAAARWVEAAPYPDRARVEACRRMLPGGHLGAVAWEVLAPLLGEEAGEREGPTGKGDARPDRGESPKATEAAHAEPPLEVLALAARAAWAQANVTPWRARARALTARLLARGEGWLGTEAGTRAGARVLLAALRAGDVSAAEDLADRLIRQSQEATPASILSLVVQTLGAEEPGPTVSTPAPAPRRAMGAFLRSRLARAEATVGRDWLWALTVNRAALAAEGRAEAGLRAYEDALGRGLADGSLWNNYAYALAQEGVGLTRALALVDRALGGGAPPRANALDTKAWVLYRRGDHGRALTVLRWALARQGASKGRSSEGQATLDWHLARVAGAAGYPRLARAALRSCAARAGTAPTGRRCARALATSARPTTPARGGD